MHFVNRLIHTTVLTSFSATAVSGWYNAAHANPLEGQIAAGTADIVNTVGRTDIHQHTERVVIDWRSFDIADGETTQFHQPGTSSIAVNRINDTKASQINGNLIANGNILLLNQNGVMFGRNANVDVGGIVASTSGLEDDQQFMQGGAIKLNRPGNADAKIVNEGKISAKQAGLVGLVAPQVENSGIISANVGKVQLASGDTYTLDFAGDGITNIAVTGDMQQQMVANSGVISANGGVVHMTAAAARDAVNSLVVNTGTIEAKSIGTKNGKIILSAEGSNGTAKTGNSTVLNSGKLDVSGKNAGEKGGEVNLLADHIGVLDGAEIDARGTAGGGTVLVGGEYQGQGTTQRAKRTVVQGNTTIDASAIENGDGGRVIVWADDRTDFAGLILAKGGAIGGDGGFVETSGKMLLNVSGNVNASSVHGQMGQWLLDPNDVIIQTAGVDTNVAGGPNFTTTDDSAIVTTGSIETALNAGTSVTITTSNLGGNSQAGNITVNNNITKSSGGAATLSLIAHNDITINGGVSIVANGTSGALNVILNADSDASGSGAISIGQYATSTNIVTNGGNIIMGGGADPTTTAAIGNATNNAGVLIMAATLNAGGGNISLRGQGYAAGANDQSGVYIYEGSLTTTGSGTITMHGTGGGTGNSNHGVWIGATGTNLSTVNGDISITGIGGTGTGEGNHGVEIGGIGAYIRTTGSGNINITGTSGASGFRYNDGIRVGSLVQTTGGGAITLTGTNTSSTSNGVLVQWGQILGSGGAINITGTSTNAAMAGNGGVGLTNNAVVSNTDSGVINITGTTVGNAWWGGSTGLGISGGSTVTAANGDITLSGSSAASGNDWNSGVIVTGASSSVSTSGSGNILVTGVKGDGANSYSMFADVANAFRTTGTGDITLTADDYSLSTAGVVASADDIFLNAYTTSRTIGIGNGAGDLNFSAALLGLLSASDVYIGNGTTNTGLITVGTADLSATNYNLFLRATSGAITFGAGGNLTLASNKNFQASTTSGNITSASTGGVVTSGTGTILLSSGNDISFTHDYDLTSATGAITLRANNDIIYSGSGDITTNNAAITLNSNRDASGAGAINLGSGTALASSGGNIIMGGGADPTTTAAIGTAANKYGVNLDGASLNSSGGAISIRGQGQNNTGVSSNFGIRITNNASVTATSGDITIIGQGGNSSFNGRGVVIGGSGTNNIISTTTGHIVITGTGGAANYDNRGVAFEAGSRISAAGGNITITGTGGAGAGSYGVSHSYYDISNTTGNINIIAISATSTGLEFTAFGDVYTTSGAINITASNMSMASHRIGKTGTTTGDITINTDGFTYTSGSIETAGNVYFNPYTTNRTIGIGNGAGDLNFSAALLGLLSASDVYIGNGTTNTGLITVGTADLSATNYNLFLRGTSADITFGAGGNLTLAANKNFSASTTTGDITSASTGGVVTSGTGTILLASGDDINFSHDYDLTSATGAIILRANKHILYSGGGDITTNNAAITLNSNRDAVGDGYISLGGGTILASNGGNITLGGGADPTTTTTQGGGYGIYLDTATFNAGGGNISMRGRSGTFGGGSEGISMRGTTISTTGNGTILLYGDAAGSGSGYGVAIGAQFGANTITAQNGSITITARNANYSGVAISGTGGAYNSIYTTGSGGMLIDGGTGGITIHANSGVHRIGHATQSGNISLVGDSFTMSGVGATITTTNGVHFGTTTASTAMGVGDGAGAFAVNALTLQNISATNVYVGDGATNTGLITVGTADLSAENYNLFVRNTSGAITFGAGGNLTLASNKNFQASTTSGDITSASTGGVVTSGTGTILLSSGNDISFTHDYDLTTGGGAITLRANNSIIESGSGDIVSGGGAITINSDRDASGAGAIYFSTGTNLTSSGGNITLGGGADPTLGSAVGTSAHRRGIYLANAAITAAGGNIIMRGLGYADTASFNYGIELNNTTASTTGAGTITVVGQGGGITNSEGNFGVYAHDTGRFITVNGTIDITGTGGGGAGGSLNDGVYFLTGGVASSTSGAITITGTAGTAGGISSSHGIHLSGASNSITTSGNITLIGTGATTGTGGIGVYIHGATIAGTGTGSILLRGSRTQNGDRGIQMAATTNITNQGGSITLESPQSIYTASTTINSNGGAIVFNSDTDASGSGAINLDTSTSITSGGGNITLGGGATPASDYAYGTSTDINGIRLFGASINAGAGSITMHGWGQNNSASAAGNTYGVNIVANSTVQSTNGAITIYGHGGNSGAGPNSHGFYIAWATMTTTSGNITIEGTGGNNNHYNSDGVVIISSGATSTSVTSTSGHISITGTAGQSARYNDGVTIVSNGNGTYVRTSGAGNVTVVGYGGSGGTDQGDSYGVLIGGGSGNGVVGSIGTGSASITGTAGTAVSYTTYGISITGTGQVVAGTNATLDITGNGGVGNSSYGTYIAGAVTGNGGAMTINGNHTVSNRGIYTASGANITNQNGSITFQSPQAISLISATVNSNGGAIVFNSDTDASGGEVINASATNVTSGGGNITFSDAVVLAGALTTSSGAGTTAFSSTINGAYDLTITGAAATFAGDIGGSTALDDVSITTTNALTLPSITAATIFARTTDAAADITIAAGKTLTASGAGNALVLAAGRNLINNSNASALSASNGRWIIYSNKRGDDTTGGLTPAQEIGGQTYGTMAPGAVPNPTQNSWIYATTLGSITIIANAISGVFGGLIPTYTYSFSCSDGCAATVMSGALTSAVGNAGDTITSNVGTYGITIGSLAASNGYQINYTSANLTVTPASLTVTATAGQNKTYGAADPGAFAYTYTGLVNGDLTANFSGALSRAVGENAGNYAINQNTLAATGNYTITTYNSNNFVINPYALTVTANAGQSKTYGAANPTYTYTYGALQNGDTAAVLSGALDRAAGENVGNYAINQGTFSAGSNYTINFVSNNFAINPYTLNVSADAISKIYGDADPSLTYTYGALQNGDNASIFSGALARVAGETVLGGPYAISQGTLSAGSNYTLSFTGNNLSITPRALTVVSDAQSKLLADADPAFTGSNNLLAGDAGLVSWVYAPQGYAGALGSYLITATATDPTSVLSNYTRTNNYGYFSVVNSVVPETAMPSTVRWRMNTVDDIVIQSKPPLILPDSITGIETPIIYTLTPTTKSESSKSESSKEKESYDDYEPATGGSPFESIDMSIFYNPYDNVIRLRPRTRTKHADLD